jgi:hypothetical protein
MNLKINKEIEMANYKMLELTDDRINAVEKLETTVVNFKKGNMMNANFIIGDAKELQAIVNKIAALKEKIALLNYLNKGE